jgi:hypothetical protein
MSGGPDQRRERAARREVETLRPTESRPAPPLRLTRIHARPYLSSIPDVSGASGGPRCRECLPAPELWPWQMSPSLRATMLPPARGLSMPSRFPRPDVGPRASRAGTPRLVPWRSPRGGGLPPLLAMTSLGPIEQTRHVRLDGHHRPHHPCVANGSSYPAASRWSSADRTGPA